MCSRVGCAAAPMFFLSLPLLLLISCSSYLSGIHCSIQLGNEILRDNNYDLLNGHRVAILTNPTGIYQDNLFHIVDDITTTTNNHKLFDLIAIFGPEHGFRGEKQAETGDELMYIDQDTQLPVFSAYSMNSTQIAHVIERMNITLILVDMQDVGIRLYTFIWTMYDVMAACAINNNYGKVTIVICDRPNPLGGLLVNGPMLNMSCCQSGYGKYPIPHIHGLTIAELGLLFNQSPEISLPTENVIPVLMKNWQRHMLWKDTKLAWVPPSPNVPTPDTALAYGATVFLEATTISEGRGTTTPFETFGAPFLNANDVAKRLNSDFQCPSTSAAFRASYYQPTFSKYNDSVVSGVQWIHDSNRCQRAGEIQPIQNIFLDGTRILCAVKELSNPASSFQWDGSWFGHPGTELIDQYAGTPLFREMIDNGFTPEEIVSAFADDEEQFLQLRKEFLLY